MFYFTIKNDLDIIINKINQEYSINLKPILSYSDFEEYDYQSNVLFPLKNNAKKEEIQSYILNELINTGHYKNVNITGKGFLSISINPETCLEVDAEVNEETVIVDYCGVNVAKKMHIGHIRSMFIGDYIANHNEYLGNNVIRVNHLGDWGNQFGYLLHYIFSNNIKIASNEHLTECYKKSYELYCQDSEFANQANIVAGKLQNYEEPYLSLWKKCCDISITEMNHITSDFGLNISSKDICGESFYSSHLKDLEQILLDSKVVSLGDDGSLVYKTDKNYPLMLKKSNGSYLYAMYDIAAIYYRILNFDPDKIIYVVDKRQSDHFKAVFELAKKLNWSEKCKFQHLAFGFILGQNGKPLKTKSGQNLYLDELLIQGKEEILKNPFYSELPEQYQHIVIKSTLYGSLKWFDLHSNPSTDYQFNWEHIFNNTAGMAPYLFHAFARIDSIIFKYNKNNNKIYDDLNLKELPSEGLALYQKTQILNEQLFLLNETNSCNILEEKLLDVIKSFHYFYEKVNILNSPNKDNLISLLSFTKILIEDCFEIFGLKPYISQSHWQHLQSQKTNKISL